MLVSEFIDALIVERYRPFTKLMDVRGDQHYALPPDSEIPTDDDEHTILLHVEGVATQTSARMYIFEVVRPSYQEFAKVLVYHGRRGIVEVLRPDLPVPDEDYLTTVFLRVEES